MLLLFRSDNGFESNAGHRRQPGKTLPYEEDINVPLIVRSPFTPRGVVDSHSVYTLADLGATILRLAGAEADYEHDGAIVPITEELRKEAEEAGGTQQHILVSYWVEGVGEGKYGSAFSFLFGSSSTTTLTIRTPLRRRNQPRQPDLPSDPRCRG